jgi:peptidoglycan hydrolase-like protein with peptidoglycan-binding domain
MFICKQIKIGDNGNRVLLLQEILKARGLYSGNLDKSFGSQTLKAVQNYQRSRNLTVDGIVGPATWKDLIAI